MVKDQYKNILGDWLNWGKWSGDCSYLAHTCGFILRTRKCSRPGLGCDGERIEYQECTHNVTCGKFVDYKIV